MTITCRQKNNDCAILEIGVSDIEQKSCDESFSREYLLRDCELNAYFQFLALCSKMLFYR